jgi:hypothetical protein
MWNILKTFLSFNWLDQSHVLKNFTSWFLVSTNSAPPHFLLWNLFCCRGRFWTTYFDMTCNEAFVNISVYFIRIHTGLSKVMHPILWNVLSKKKKKDIDIIKQTVLYVGNLHHAQQYMHSLIYSCFLHPVEGFVQWCFKYTDECSVSVLLMCAGCFYSLSLWKTTRDGNAVVLDPEIKKATNLTE